MMYQKNIMKISGKSYPALLFLLLLLFSFIAVSSTQSLPASEETIWYEKDVNNQPVIHLYFFWSKKCPHC